jgi:LPXTG-site transpeptidase (sortase) family protein
LLTVSGSDILCTVRKFVYGLAMSLALVFVVGGEAPAHAATGHRGVPLHLAIPAIGVSAPVVSLRGHRSGLLEVPPLGSSRYAAWYRFSAVPGYRGNAVLVGHVDTYLGPAVFYNLYRLRRGDSIYVSVGRGHRAVRYAVRWVREVPKRRFPSRLVFGRTHARRLWLITCGGNFDYVTRSYEDNIIVSATR